MSSPEHRLTTTGRLVINLAVALSLYAALTWLPEFNYSTLIALLAVAVIASLIGGITVSMPTPSSKPARASGKTLEGSIKWFNGTKGFGFITGDDGTEVFVHFRSVNGLGKRSIKPGQRVTYKVTDSDRGPQAEDVNPL